MIRRESCTWGHSFSKTFAPGVRVGWELAPPAVCRKLVIAAESAMLCHSSLAQLLVREYLCTQPWQAQMKVFRQLYQERRDVMLDTLDAAMPTGCQWTKPTGGFYVWLKLPDKIDSKAMLPRALSSHVAYVPGTGFYADGQGAQYMRLSYCFPDSDRISEGVRRLANVIEAEIGLRDMLGSGAGPTRLLPPRALRHWRPGLTGDQRHGDQRSRQSGNHGEGEESWHHAVAADHGGHHNGGRHARG
jgi:alanine-alpha-ketoisovalerate/valine-pyruvate aminotransferase